MTWWNPRENIASAVYRPGVVLPLMIVAASLALAYVVTGPHRLGDVWIFLLIGVFFAALVMIRRHGAVILTPRALLYRPAGGKVLEIPLSGIKRVTLIEPESGEEGADLTLPIELLVSGPLSIPLDVRKSEELAERVIAAVKAMQR